MSKMYGGAGLIRVQPFSQQQHDKDMDRVREKIGNIFRIEDKKIIRQFLAELIGTFFLVFIGTSANVQQAVAVGGNSTSAHIAWGIGFMFAVFLAASVSGAHLNPAISFCQFLLGNITIPRMFVYFVAQFIGAFLGAAATYFGHHDDLWKISGDNRWVGGQQGTAGLFATYPTSHMSIWGSLLDQIIGTAILSGLICLITDARHRIHSALVPVLAGSIMTMVAMTYGANGGFAINPARDFGPRLWCLIAGWGWEAFSANSYYFWIPLVGPMIGAIFGAFIYKLFVGLHGGRDKLVVTNEAFESTSGPRSPHYGAAKAAQGYNEEYPIAYNTYEGGTLVGFARNPPAQSYRTQEQEVQIYRSQEPFRSPIPEPYRSTAPVTSYQAYTERIRTNQPGL